jgi:hypothetical protein
MKLRSTESPSWRVPKHSCRPAWSSFGIWVVRCPTSGVTSALGNRYAPFSFVTGMITRPGEVERIDAIQRDLFEGLSEWDTGGALPNFLGADSDPASVKRAYEETDYKRLQAIKGAYDPGNQFRINHNIPPAA